MPRQAREISPTGYYHVMMRGINREFIYSSNQSKAFFLRTLKQAQDISVAAYCVMDNHVHLVLHAEPPALAAALRRLNLTYALWYNGINERVGHVFQNRYHSEIILSEADLLAVIRYVHKNPQKADIVRDPTQYTWSSLREYIGHLDVVAQPEKEFVLGMTNGLAGFITMHGESRIDEFLDTPEDIVAQRLGHAKALIADFCYTHNVADPTALKTSPELLGLLVLILFKNTKLSHRTIAGLLGVSANVVHRTSLKQ